MDPSLSGHFRDLQAFQRRNSEPCIPSTSTGSTEEHVASIDAEISRTEDAIVRLVKHRAILKRRRNAFSPAVKLPAELLALIFEFACLPTDVDDHIGWEGYPGATNLNMGVGSGAVTPLFLGSVCNAWRTIAFRTSQLWNRVIIHLNERHSEAQGGLLRRWLSRTRQRPLWIKVMEDESTTSENEDDNSWGIDVTSTKIIDILAEHSTQWHTVNLFLPSTWKQSLSRIRNNLPNLKSITLRPAEGSPTLSRVNAFSLARALRNITIIGYSISEIFVPWAQLERVDGEYFCVSEALDVLRMCPCLLRAQFTQLSRGLPPFLPPPVQHDQLEALELILDSSDQLHRFFGAMTLPNLKELVLSLSDDESLLGAVMPLLRRSGCAASLTHLHLVGQTPMEDELIGCLEELSGLEVFLLINPVMSGGKLTDRILRLMKPMSNLCSAKHRAHTEDIDEEMDQGENGESCLLPRLRRLEYQGPIAFDSRTLVEILVSRWCWTTSSNPSASECKPTINTAQLKSVVLTTERRITFGGQAARTVQKLMEEGMSLQFLKDPNGNEPGW